LGFEERAEMIVDRLARLSNLDALMTVGSPQTSALTFIIGADPLQLCPDSPLLVQRYVAAVLYYSTGGPQWRECSEGSLQCNMVGDGSTFAGNQNWLSGTNECQWGGITCTQGGTGIIGSIFIGKWTRLFSVVHVLI
jgi:hypothetical protein